MSRTHPESGDVVWGPLQRAAPGPDPFQDADRPESDPARSASGAGRAALTSETLEQTRRLREAKRAEARRLGWGARTREEI